MLHKTTGIVFRFTKYGETSIIVTIFTELFGLQSYIVNGVRSSARGSKIALFQPLTLLDLVVYHKENVSVMRIKEVKCLHPYQALTTDVRKSAIGMFLNEILNKSVKEQSHAQELSHFLIHSFQRLDLMEKGYENFHLIFLIKLSQYLGFRPYQAHEILGSGILHQQEELALRGLLEMDYDDPLSITLEQRRNLLDLILRFYASHIDQLGEIRSLQVVRELMY
jgi:DNA repair protein RecO (recombination protein O)